MKELLITLALLVIFCGCRTQYIPKESVYTEYHDEVNDVIIKDSVVNDKLIYVNGDTVYIQTWRDRWHIETRYDSIYINVTDTIRIPYPVEKIVEVKSKSLWKDIAKDTVAFLVVALIILLLGYLLTRKREK